MSLLPFPKPADWPFGDLDLWCHDVIAADVPVKFDLYSEKGNLKAASSQYAVMTDEALMRLPVALLAKPHCLLLYWTTGWAIATGRAQAVVRAWGAEPVTELVWIKTTRLGKVRVGPGYRARTMHEPILLAKWGMPKHTPFPSEFRGLARRHSEKPVEFYDMVARHTPNQVRCDLFSAGIIRPGFFGWGEDHRTPEGNNVTRTGPQRAQPASFFGTEV